MKVIETKMEVILVDSYNDRIILDGARVMDEEAKICLHDYFIPCEHCGCVVLFHRIADWSGCCIRCETGNYTMEPITYIKSGVGTGPAPVVIPMVTVPQPKPGVNMNIEERVKLARQEAEDAFWAVIVKHFPEAVDGSFLMSDMEDIMKTWVDHWVDCNVPSTPCNKPESNAIPEDWTEDLGLHHKDIWHNHQTGGGCTVVTSDNFVVNREHRYLGITSECVVVYTDTFLDDDFLNVWEECNTWSFGDNPTVLMNIIDEAFGGVALWDTGKLFDDIMTIAKSGKC